MMMMMVMALTSAWIMDEICYEYDDDDVDDDNDGEYVYESHDDDLDDNNDDENEAFNGNDYSDN